MARNGRVYVMDAGNGLLKIGCSKAPQSRAKSLGGIPVLYESVWLSRAQLVEKRVQTVLKRSGHHASGELFAIDLAAAIAAIESAVAMEWRGEMIYREPNRRKKVLAYSLDRDLLREIDQWIAAQSTRVTRTSVVEKALKEFLDERGG